ncbi:hypothetical protein GCM10022409_22070 [Hymenobacter glaciei]|uniref:DUF4221 domain-containing protein n=1 Tax=Hymenobacter glaciei TaxID=877209 RepID=A0ABP7U644_9BACT
MLIRLFTGPLAAVFLLMAVSCNQTQHAETATPPKADAPVVATPARPRVVRDTADVSQTSQYNEEGQDTSFWLGRQRYRLLLRAETDSTKPLVAVSEGLVGGAFADDTSTFAQTQRVRGYEGGQVITLLAPAGQPVFRRRLRKQDFFSVASRDIVTVSDPARPRFIGYHGPSQTLVFTLGIGIPSSDVGQQCVIMLGLDGQVRRLAPSYSSNWSAPDCAPRLLADGTVLTCQELLGPDGRRVSLLKPKAELVAALVLSDSTLLTMYQYGEYRDRPVEGGNPLDVSAGFYEPEWAPDPRKRDSPNAFVVNARGQVRQRFRYQGFGGAMGYEVPRHYVPASHTYYLLDEERGLCLLDKQRPTLARELLFRQMERFRKPLRPAEVPFSIETETSAFTFYADTLHPEKVRYQRKVR